MTDKMQLPLRGRKLLWKSLPAVIVLQFLVLLAAGAAIFFIVDLDLSKNFYSAHRSIKSAQDLLLPALLLAGGGAFLFMGVVAWLGLRSYSRRLTAPIIRSDQMLRRLAAGDLTYTPGVLTRRDRWAIDESAQDMIQAYRGQLHDIQNLSREIHKTVLSLRYKATGTEPLTLKELREVTGFLDTQCKELNATLKWFET